MTTETYFSTCGECRYCRTGHENLCLNRRSIGSAVNGGFTNFVIVPAKNIHRLPERVDFLAGALTEPPACVVHAMLTTPTVTPGDEVVIAGPGAIELLALQVAKAAARSLLPLTRRGARCVQIGLFGKPITWDLEQVCYKELVVTGSSASVSSAWVRALQLLESGNVQTKPLITAVCEVTEWGAAFAGFERKTAIKTVLRPAAL